MARISRPPFRQGLTYVAIRHLRLSAATRLQPGDVVDLPTHRLRRLFRRRRIGPQGHPWTEHFLANQDGYPLNSATVPTELPESAEQTEQTEQSGELPADDPTDEAAVNETNDDASPADGPEQDEE